MFNVRQDGLEAPLGAEIDAPFMGAAAHRSVHRQVGNLKRLRAATNDQICIRSNGAILLEDSKI